MIQRTLSRLHAWLRFFSPSTNTKRRQPTVRMRVEQLEDRVNPSAGLREQYMLELINRMRENPSAELPILLNSGDPDVASALAYFNVNQSVLQNQWNSLTSAPPLAWNDALASAARGHNQAMLAAGVQSHQVAGEAGLGSRATSAGYSSWSALGENVYAYAESIFAAHAAFAIDWGNTSTGIQNPAGHRLNLMSTDFRDVGIGVLTAPGGSNLGPLLITQDFGNRFSYGNPYLLGVVYDDVNANGYYDQGEGLAGATLTITGANGTTTAATTAYGGYQVQLAAGNYSITASGGGLVAPITYSVTIGSNNRHLNFINGSVPPENASVPFSDDFNRDNSSFLGPYWQERSGNFAVANNAVVGIGTPISLATVNGATLADTSLQADIFVGPGQSAGLTARYQNNGNFYLGQISANSTGMLTANIFKYVAATGFTQLNTATTLITSGVGTLRFEVVGKSLKLYLGADADNLTLVAYAFDKTISTAGLTGMRARNGGALDNFALDDFAPIPVTDTSFTDLFTQPNGSQLSRTWIERAGNFDVSGNQLVARSAAISLATVHGLALADTFVAASVNVAARQHAGLIARYQANGSFYYAQISADTTGTAFTANIYKFATGIFTKLSTATVAGGAGTLRFEVVGNSLKLFFGPDADNLSLAAYAFDKTISAAGSTGMRAFKDAVLDDYTTGPIVSVSPSSPFTDTFTQDNGSQLARAWTERQGNFMVANSRLIANGASSSLATVNGIALADVAVQADIAVAANQAAGLVTRYQANGNYYFAQISANSAGTVTANIYKFAAGTLTRLNATPFLLGTGVGTLRFEVAGTSLRLYFGADAASLALAVSVVDSTIAAAGLTGIRATKNAALDNYTFG